MWPREVEIVVEGRLEGQWLEWFSPLTLLPLPNGQTRLCGQLEDQSALRGLLERIFDLNLTLVLVISRAG